MKVELPLGTPFLKSDATRAETSSIVSLHKDHENWLFNNNIGVRVALDFLYKENTLNFNTITPTFAGGIPFVKHQSIYKNLLYDGEALLHIVKSALSKGFYIECSLDWYYLPERFSYQDRHYIHQEFLYGFDDDRKEIMLIGFSNSRDFEKTVISYDQFKSSAGEQHPDDKHLSNKIHFMRIEPTEDYNRKPDRTIKMLHEYLSSKNLCENLYEYYDCTTHDPNEDFIHQYRNIYSKENFMFGLNCYDYMLAYFRDEQINGGFRRAPINSLVALCNHKTCMLTRINMFNRIGYINDEDCKTLSSQYLAQVHDPCRTLLNLWLKFEVTKKRQNIEKIILHLPQIKNAEEEILSGFLSHINYYEKV